MNLLLDILLNKAFDANIHHSFIAGVKILFSENHFGYRTLN